jgi:hypothetical protein
MMTASFIRWLMTLMLLQAAGVETVPTTSDPLSTCSADGWCRKGPYLPDIKSAQGERSAWLLLDHHVLLQRKLDSSTWTRVSTPEGRLVDIAAVPGKDDLWLLSQRPIPCDESFGCGETLVGRLSGGSWSTHVLRGKLYSIWAATPDDVWTVGGYYELDREMLVIYRWVSGGRRREPLSADWHWTRGPLEKVWGLGTSDVWAIGGPAIFHFSGLRWKQIRYHPWCRRPVPRPGWAPPNEHYDDIFPSKGEIWIVSTRERGRCALNLDKHREVLIEVNADRAPPRPIVPLPLSLPPGVEEGVAAPHFGRPGVGWDWVVIESSGKIWMERRGGFLSFDGQLWRELPREDVIPDRIESLSDPRFRLGFPPEGLLRYAQEHWKLQLPAPFSGYGHWISKNDPFIILGSDGSIFRLSDETRGKLVKPFKPKTPFTPIGLWGSAADDLWIVATPCDTGEQPPWAFAKHCPHDLYHFDGTAIVGAGKVATRPTWFRAIHGSAKDDVWVVGDRGATAHYDGSDWTIHPTGTRSRLNSVWSAGPSEAWAVGNDGTILQWDGQGWIQRESDTRMDLHAVRGSKAAGIWVAGDFGVILHHPSLPAAQAPP